ncbi:MAG: STAS domain-containing protein [Gallionella sp.]
MINYADGCLQVEGHLTMDTVPALYEQGLQHLKQNELILDFSKVETADSSAVSMLLGWTRAAKQNKCEVSIVNLPSSMLSLAGLYGVSDLLPVQVN